MSLRLLILPLLFIAITLPAFSKTPNEAQQAFWTWFNSRESEFAKLFSYETQSSASKNPEIRTITQKAIKEVAEKLRGINAEFSPFFGYSDGANQLTITVHGQSEHFAAVDQFIASAPKIIGWEFISLKRPLNFDAATEIKSGTVRLKLGDFRYSKSQNAEGLFDFVIYIPAKVADDPEGFERLVSSLTADLAGERLAATAIGDVSVRQLNDKSPHILHPFVDIRADIERSKRKE